jgi:hypothetical protein
MPGIVNESQYKCNTQPLKMQICIYKIVKIPGKKQVIGREKRDNGAQCGNLSQYG